MTPMDARKEAMRWAQIEKDDPDFALLHYAEIGHLGKVKKLLARGADADSVQHIDTGIEQVKDTPLYASAGAGHIAVAQALIAAGAEVDIEADDGWRPLHHATLNGQSAMVAFLAASGADINRREELEGQTPLHIACARADEKTVAALVKAGARRDVRDNLGRMPEDVIGAIGGAASDTQDKKRRTGAIRQIFANAAAAEHARAEAAAAALTTLQKDISIAKPVTVRRRMPK